MNKREMSWSAARKILNTVIHFDGGVKKYDIAKESDLAECTIYREVPKMAEKGLLSCNKLNKKAPGGQELKMYKITTKGILVVLSMEKNSEVKEIMNDLVSYDKYSRNKLLNIARGN